MEHANGPIWEVSFWEFVFVTVILGGGAAALTGRAMARTWQEPWRLLAYVVLLTGAVRFIHFALFHGTLLSLWYYLVDLCVLVVFALAAMRATRARQMTTRYGFIYRAAGPFNWARK